MNVVNFTAHVRPSQVVIHFTPQSHRTLWMTLSKFREQNNYYFSPDLLEELQTTVHRLKKNNFAWMANGALQPVDYAVLKSAHPDYFSLGGDLAYFRQCIEQQHAQLLRDYSLLCLDMVYGLNTQLSSQIATIALVQGRALGGGFETALAADFIIAEEQSEFGFPEILFGLFPCTGGMSLLARRVGVYQAERMMTDGKIYKAPELKEMGVIDEICPKGQGIMATEEFIHRHAKQRTARMLLQSAKYRLAPLNYDELRTVVDEWVEAAMNLSEHHLRVMDMLIQLQRVQRAA